MKCMICKHGETKQGTTKELLTKARSIVENGVEVDIRKYEIAA